VDCGGGCAPCDEAIEDEYTVLQGARTLEEARNACAENGDTLAVIKDRYHNMVAKKVCGASCWIGLTRPEACRTPSCFRWDNGLFLDETVFNHFGSEGQGWLYKDGYEGMELTQMGHGEWERVPKGEKVDATLCSKTESVKRQEGRLWRIFLEHPRAHKWGVRATLFLDATCKVPVGEDSTIMMPSSVLDTRVWTQCLEGDTCTCTGYVRMGVDKMWSASKRSSGDIKCSTDIFGDAAWGHKKHCECIADAEASKPSGSTPVVAKLTEDRPVGCVKLEGVASQEGIKVSVEYQGKVAGPWTVAPRECTLVKDGVTLCRPWNGGYGYGSGDVPTGDDASKDIPWNGALPEDDDPRLMVYWDKGNCGPGLDDQNVSLCGGMGVPDCPKQISVDQSICATKSAHLEAVVGEGTYERTHTLDGCEYYYYAQYGCS